VEYPAPGSEWLARRAREAVTRAPVGLDEGWGLDHGCWSVLRRMFPDASVPVVQMSLDHDQPARHHYEIARDLAPLRKEGVLVVGSGNMVHNLFMVRLKGDDFNERYGFDWELVDYQLLGDSVRLAVPTPEHYLPMIYALALREEGDSLSFFNDAAVGGSVTMTSFRVG
jgi:4,5-DOPA dioxygenase extradiol